MSADELRRAAALMRERAEAAGTITLDRPWGSDGEQVTGGDGQWMLVATTSEVPSGSEDALADHIAGMDPVVAIAIADWLDATADYTELAVDGRHPGWKANKHHALAVARTYLGERPEVPE